MKVSNYGTDHPFAVVRGRVAGTSAVGTASLDTIDLVVITPAQLVANTDNWNPTGLETASVIRASTDASRNLTGLVAPSDDRLMILANIGAFDLVLVHDATSTAANRFYCPSDTDVTLTENAWTWLLYDLASARWRVLGAGSGSIPSGTYVLTIEGGQEKVNARGTLGATETVDPTDGNIITGTLDQDCAITVSAPTGSEGSSLEWWFDGTSGPWTPTFSPTGGSFAWDGGVTPTFPASGFRVLTERIPGTTNDLIGNMVGGGGGSPVEVLDEGVSLTAAVTSIDFVGDGVTATAVGDAVTVTVPGGSGAHYLVIASAHSTPLVFDDIVQNSAGDDFVYTT